MPNTWLKLYDSLPSLWIKLQGQGVGAVLARGAGGSFAVMALGAVMAFGVNMLLARVLGVTQYGIYIYVLTWINLLALVCQFGMDTSLVRFVAAYNTKGDWGLLRGILRRSIQYVVISSVFVGLTTALVIWILYSYIGSEQAITFWIALFLLPLLALTGLRHSALRALKHVVQSTLPDSFFRPLLIAVLAGGLFLYTQQNIQATQVMVFNIIGAITAFLIGTVWLVKALPKEIKYNSPVYAEWEWLKVSLPLFFVSGMHRILKHADILMVGILLGPAHAGIYAVATRIAELVVFGEIAVNAIAAPMISELHSTGQFSTLQRMFTIAVRGVFSFTFLVSSGLALLGVYVLSLFGQDFIVGYTPMLILLIGQIFKSFFGSAGFLMSMTGHQNQAAVIVGVSAALNILMNIILIPKFGLIGAAVATAVSNILWSFFVQTYVRNQLNINPTIMARIK